MSRRSMYALFSPFVSCWLPSLAQPPAPVSNVQELVHVYETSGFDDESTSGQPTKTSTGARSATPFEAAARQLSAALNGRRMRVRKQTFTQAEEQVSLKNSR